MEDAPTLLRHARAPRACNLVRSGARVPFPTRVVGGGSRSAEQPGRRESRGLGPGRGEGGEGEHGIVRTACEGDSQGIGGRVSAGLGTSRRQTCKLRRGKSIALQLSDVALGVRERSRSSAHPLYAAPTRPPVRVSGSHTRPTWGSRVGLDPASEPCLACHELPDVRSGR